MTSSPKPSVALIILTWNASQYISPLFQSIGEQTWQPNHTLVIDSSSTDNTVALLQKYPAEVKVIPQNEFNHGGTRRLATELLDADIYIYLTQDALPANPNTLENIITALINHPEVGCAYGKQLPRHDANPLGIHLRLFNYPAQSQLRSHADKNKYGIKTCFNSDSFAAYKKTALQKIGGFPTQAAFGEDVYLAAKLLLAGFQVYYAADAEVIHSHNHSLKEEFQRYLAIGKFHHSEQWILNEFSAPTRQGIKFIQSEIGYLFKSNNLHWLPRAAASWVAKFLGYKLGFNGGNK